MVSFSCESCGDVLTKKKLDPHRNRCHGASFTCIDCMVYFPGTEYRSHTSCISEEQKYQGALYKPKKEKQNQNQNAFQIIETSVESTYMGDMAHKAYVEDVPEDLEEYRDYDDDDDDDDSRSRIGPMPHAPTPPPAIETAREVNVFDFLVGNPTPKASNSDLRGEAAAHAEAQPSQSTELVRYNFNADDVMHEMRSHRDGDTQLVQYGGAHVPVSHALQTPVPKTEKKKSKDGFVKKDKKRKRLHVDTHDLIMTDAPPVLHSGLTGGLNGLMSRPSVFPPSPEYSADAAETPASPLKKSRHSKHSKSRESIGNNLISMLTSSKPSKIKKRKQSTTSSSPKKKKSSSSSSSSRKSEGHHHKSDNGDKLIEYRPGSKDSKDGAANDKSVVVFNNKGPAEMLLSFVNKGPDSARGCSMNKALKRFHRERSASGDGLGKLMDEKELWKSLRMRRNDRGEVVLFCV